MRIKVSCSFSRNHVAPIFLNLVFESRDWDVYLCYEVIYIQIQYIKSQEKNVARSEEVDDF